MSAIPHPTGSSASVMQPNRRERALLDDVGRAGLLVTLALAAAAYIAALATVVTDAAAQTAPALLSLLAGLIVLALGVWVRRRRPGKPVGRMFLALCAVLAAVLASSPGMALSPLLGRVWSASMLLAAGLFVAFSLIFPTEVRAVAVRPALRWLPVLPTVALIAYTQLASPPTASTVALVKLYAGVALLASTAVLLMRSLAAASPTVREQSRVAIIGALLAALAFILWATQASISPAWLLLPTLACPALLAYSISQYGLLDTDRLLSYTLTYTIMGITVMLGYALIVAGANVALGALLGTRVSAANPLLVGLLAFAVALGFDPVRQRLQRTLDARLFRADADHQERLPAFRHQLTLVSGLDDVVRLLKQQVREGLLPTHAYVFLRDPQTGDFIAVGEGSRPDTDVRFEPGSGLVHALSTAREVLFLEPDRPLPPEMIEDQARLAILHAPVLAALQGQDRLAGWLAVGAKRSGEPYTIHDLRFVQALAEQASLAVERAQVIADLERRLRELDVLSQVAQAVNFTTDPDVLLELIYAQSSKLIDTTNFYIVMHDPDTHSLVRAFFLENDERLPEHEGERWPDDEGLVAEIVRTGRPIRTADYRAECVRRGIQPRDSRHLAWIGVPLNTGARTGGVMVVASYDPTVTFSDDQLKVFWAIADQAATALDKARLFNETETRARQLGTLNEIATELSSTLDLEGVLERIMRAAVEIIGVEAGSLLLLDEASGELVYRMVEGGKRELVGMRLPLGVGVVSEAVEARRPVIMNSASQALLAVPLLVQDRSIGVLELINRRDGAPFGDDDSALLWTFAAQAAVAIDNARLYEATDAELARRVDELQNLQRIDRELNRTLDLGHVAQTTLDWAMRQTGAAAGLVGLVNGDEGLDVLASRGADGRLPEPGAPFPLDGGISARVLATGQPELVTGDGASFVALLGDEAPSQIAVPIRHGESVTGLLLLENPAPDGFKEPDFDFAQRLVEHAAVAIENARLVQEVRDANRSKTEFISFVSHELKNPMTSIRGYTDLLRGGQVGPVSEMQEQFLGTIRANVDRMTRLVSDLSDIARIESGRLRLEMEPTAVGGVVDETLRGLEAQIEEKQQQVELKVEEDLPPLHADYTRMVQVLTNLVSNAHKYTPEGGLIEIGAQLEQATHEETGETQEVVHHWVRDSGIGMTGEELDQLFTKFFRSPQAKDMAPGTGLGLNITRSLVEQHGGMVWVESVHGEGSTFHYTIPTASIGDASE